MVIFSNVLNEDLFVDNGKYGGYYKLLKTKINLQMQTIFMN
jgi:hypothetical protein